MGTCLEKYGVDNVSKVDNIKVKIFKNRSNSFNQNDIKMGCSKHFCPNIGRNEAQILNEIENNEKINIIRQFPVCVGYVDGYCKETNTVYEIDEKYHEKQKEKDLIRQQKIEDELGCKFIRIKDY